MEANELIRRIAEYGADMEGIHDRFGDDAALYESCFVSLVEDPQFAALSAAMAAGDYEAAFNAAHPIKGLAGNLALTPFYETVCTFVEALRAKDYSHIEEDYARVETQYQALLDFYRDGTKPDVKKVGGNKTEETRISRRSDKRLFGFRKAGAEPKAMFTVLFGLSVVLLLFSAFMFYRSTAKIEQAVLEERTEYVTEISKQIINNEQTLTKMYREIAADYAGIVSRENILSLDDLRTCLSDNSVMRVLVMDDEGAIIDSYGASVHLSDRELYERMENGEKETQVFTTLNDGKNYWLFTAPIHTVRIKGVHYTTFLLAVPAEEYEKSLAVSLLEGNGASFLVDMNGKIIIRPHMKRRIQEDNLFDNMRKVGISDEDVSAFRSRFGEAAEFSMIVNIEDAELLLSGSMIDKQKNCIVIVIPLSVTAADTYTGLSDSIVFVSLMVLSIALIVILMILHFYRRDSRRRKEALAVEAKDEFLSKISHDLRTPLNAIIGLETLARDSDSLDVVKDYLDESYSASRYMLTLINDMLDMNRIESGKMTIQNAPVKIGDLLDEIGTIVSAMANEKGISFNVRGKESFPDVYLADAVHIKQILMNLLSNALKFTDAGGTVTLEASREETKARFDQVSFVVDDTGAGMSKTFQSQMFVPFSQERSSSTNQMEGSGLGLSIVHSLVKLMDGTVQVESEEGAGTSFRVCLPLEKTDAIVHNGGKTPAAAASYAGKRILIVDDNRTNQLIMSELLRIHYNVKTESAVDGQQCVDAFVASLRGYYDLIFMDINMPVMGGLEATRWIRKLPRADAATIPIIALSANAYDKDVALSLSAGMNAHLAKPVTIEAISGILKEYLSNKEKP